MLQNKGPALARVALAAADVERLLVLEAPFHVRVSTEPASATVGRRLLYEVDPRQGAPRTRHEVRLPAGVPVTIQLALSAAHARIGLQAIALTATPPGPGGAPGGASRPKAPRTGWRNALAEAHLAFWRGDDDALVLAANRLDRIAPGLMAHRVLRGRDVPLSRLRDTLGDGAANDAEALRLLASREPHADQEARAVSLLERLERAADPRSHLVRFHLLRDLGWEGEAERALALALKAAPGACGPAREALQHRWDQLKLRRIRPSTVLPKGCAQTPELRPVVAHYAAEIGDVGRAAQLLAEHVARSGDAEAHGSARVRFLERMGREDESRRLARQLADKGVESVEPWFRVGDLEASLGRRRGARAAWDRATRMGAGELEGRLKLLAVGAGRVWERFRPDVDAALAKTPPADLVEGHAATLLLDHQTTLRFRDGAAIHYVHQVMRLQTTAALSDLGEVAVPDDAVILRAVTRKPDGRVLEPEDIAQKDTLSFPELEIGDAIELAYLTGAVADPSLGGGWLSPPFFFQIFDVPTLESTYVVLLQDGVDGRYESKDVPDPITVTAPGFRGWKWSGGVRKATRPEGGAVDPYGVLPRVQAWSGVGWAELEREARERLIRLTVPDHRMRALAKRLSPTDADPRSVIRAIYAEVRDGITEIDTSWLTTSAADAFATGRGERVVALIGLLRAAGFDAQLAMTDPVHRHHADRAAPDVRDFSYLLVRVAAKDGAIWLDPAFAGAEFGFLAPTVRGRPAKIIGVDGVNKPLNSPRRIPVDEQRTVRIDVRLAADGALSGRWNEVVRGMDAVTYREALQPMTEKDRRQTLASLASELLPGIRVPTVDIIDLDAPDRPVEIDRYLERRPSGRSTLEPLRLLLLPLFLSQRWIHSQTRRTDLYADRHEDLDLEIVVRLPPGIEVGKLPKDVTRRERFGEYERTVRLEPGAIRIVKRFRMRPQIVPPRGYLPFVRFCRAVDEADEIEIALSRRD